MNSSAQAGLEHLLSYGWALLLIATVIGVLLFVLSSSDSKAILSSSNPERFLLKESMVDEQSLTALLQNNTGEAIRIQKTLPSSNYDNCTIDGKEMPKVSASKLMTLECSFLSDNPTGKITIEYRGSWGVTNSVTIHIKPAAGGIEQPVIFCGNNRLDQGEFCDGTEGLSDEKNMECGSECNKIKLTGCTSLGKSGNYFFETTLSPAQRSVGLSTCIHIVGQDINLSGIEPGYIDLGQIDNAIGVYIKAGNTSIKNVIVEGQANNQAAFVANAPDDQAIALQNNIAIDLFEPGGCGFLLYSHNLLEFENFCGRCFSTKEGLCRSICEDKQFEQCSMSAFLEKIIPFEEAPPFKEFPRN